MFHWLWFNSAQLQTQLMPSIDYAVKQNKLIYIASPYTHSSQRVMTRRYNQVTKAIGLLDDKYEYAFIGPITQSRHTGVWRKGQDHTFTAWQLKDLTYISHCDEVWVLMLDGWDKSVGVTKEIEFANNHNIPVVYLDPKEILGE